MDYAIYSEIEQAKALGYTSLLVLTSRPISVALMASQGYILSVVGDKLSRRSYWKVAWE